MTGLTGGSVESSAATMLDSRVDRLETFGRCGGRGQETRAQRPAEGGVRRPAPNSVASAGEQRFVVDEADWIAKWVFRPEHAFSPRHSLDAPFHD
jgi:hypothetical protein